MSSLVLSRTQQCILPGAPCLHLAAGLAGGLRALLAAAVVAGTAALLVGFSLALRPEPAAVIELPRVVITGKRLPPECALVAPASAACLVEGGAQ